MELLSKWLHRVKIPHIGGVGSLKRTCKGLFDEAANKPHSPDHNGPADTKALGYRQGIIADLMIGATLVVRGDPSALHEIIGLITSELADGHLQ